MAALQTHHPFTLPRGYVDPSGEVHADGVMRLATARDEIAPQTPAMDELPRHLQAAAENIRAREEALKTRRLRKEIKMIQGITRLLMDTPGRRLQGQNRP